MREPNSRKPIPVFGVRAKHRAPGESAFDVRFKLRDRQQRLVTHEQAEELANWPVLGGGKLGYGR